MNATVLCLLFVVNADPDCPKAGPEVRVTVIGFLAHQRDKEVHPKAAGIAKLVQTKDKSLTGFDMARTTSKSVPVGDEALFPVCKQCKFKVRVRVEQSGDGRISLTVEPPKHEGSVTYSCKCGAFVPLMTRCVTPDGGKLVIAVMAKPCRK